jgi:hypothetical protein
MRLQHKRKTLPCCAEAMGGSSIRGPMDNFQMGLQYSYTGKKAFTGIHGHWRAAGPQH